MEYDHRFSDSPPAPPPLKAKHHLCFVSCFRPAAAGDVFSRASPDAVDHLAPLPPTTTPTPTPSAWIRSKAHEIPEFRARCRSIASHAGHCVSGAVGGGRHRRRHSADFRYDPLSYALNFDEGAEGDAPANVEEIRSRFFSSRLPASPPRGDGGGRFMKPTRARRAEDTEALL